MKSKNNLTDIPILSFHQIGPSKETAHPSIYLDVKSFDARLRSMKNWGYRFISLSEAVEMISGAKAYQPKCAVLTFDDGYEGVYSQAFPVLKKYQCVGAVFLIAGTLDKKQETAFPCLNTAQIREMHAYGIEMGVHSMTHADLTASKGNELQREITESKEKIRTICGIEPQHFCYPYGKHNSVLEEAVKGAGYKSACSTVFGRKHTNAELFKLKRISVPSGQSWLQFLYRLEIAGKK